MRHLGVLQGSGTLECGGRALGRAEYEFDGYLVGPGQVVPTHDDGGYLTTVLADPQGNEFCLIVPPADGYDWGQLIGGEG